MDAGFPKTRAVVRDFIEKIARIVIGEPARIVRKSTLERLERLAFRGELRQAAKNGDTSFIEQEICKNQLTTVERARIAGKHTPLADWPDVDEEVLAKSLFDEDQTSSSDTCASQ